MYYGVGAKVKRYVKSKILTNEELLIKKAEDFVNVSAGIDIEVIEMKKIQILCVIICNSL